MSNGAYVLREHVPQERLVRVRNEMYWDNENTIIDEVTSLVINDVNQGLTRYLAGELDRTEVPRASSSVCLRISRSGDQHSAPVSLLQLQPVEAGQRRCRTSASVRR